MRTSLNFKTPCPEDFEQRVVVALTSCWKQDRLDRAYARACEEIESSCSGCDNIQCKRKHWNGNLERLYRHVQNGINATGVNRRNPTMVLNELSLLRDYGNNPYATAKILSLFMEDDGETFKPWYMRYLHRDKGYLKEPCMRDRLKAQAKQQPKKITRTTTEIIEY